MINAKHLNFWTKKHDQRPESQILEIEMQKNTRYGAVYKPRGQNFRQF